MVVEEVDESALASVLPSFLRRCRKPTFWRTSTETGSGCSPETEAIVSGGLSIRPSCRRTVPAVGLINPDMQRSNVVLPRQRADDAGELPQVSPRSRGGRSTRENPGMSRMHEQMMDAGPDSAR
jgi:hypothetical protein